MAKTKQKTRRCRPSRARVRLTTMSAVATRARKHASERTRSVHTLKHIALADKRFNCRRCRRCCRRCRRRHRRRLTRATRRAARACGAHSIAFLLAPRRAFERAQLAERASSSALRTTRTRAEQTKRRRRRRRRLARRRRRVNGGDFLVRSSAENGHNLFCASKLHSCVDNSRSAVFFLLLGFCLVEKCGNNSLAHFRFAASCRHRFCVALAYSTNERR